MAITKLDLARQAKGEGVASQATHIESSRAIAQVQGALIVAQQRPRDEMRAFNRMQAACSLETLAERAFFSYARAGSQITGPSIHLASELARCWGNVDYGITELSRGEGQSEMQAYAWDLETNARVTNSFIVPHVRDTRSKGQVALTDVRDVYENNANMGARRLRECIFRVLPVSFREEAERLCSETLETGGGEPIEGRRAKLVEAFAALGVNRKRIEKRAGRSADQLTPYDLGVLRVVYQTMRRGETTATDEFPDDAGGEAAEELRAKAPKAEATATARTPPVQQGPAETKETPPADDEPALPLDQPAGAQTEFRIRFENGEASRRFATADDAVAELCTLAATWDFEEIDAVQKANDALLNAASDEMARRFVGIRTGKAPGGKGRKTA